MNGDPGAEAYEREIEARFAPLDYPGHLPKPPIDCGRPCACDHYHEPDDPDEGRS